MKKLFFWTINILFLSHIAMAGEASEWIRLDIPVEKITRWDYFCQTATGGGAYAIDLKGNHIWQTDPGSDSGIPLSQVQITLARCPHCYRFTGKLSYLGQTMDVTGVSSFGFGAPDIKLSVTLKSEANDQDGGADQSETKLEMTCKTPTPSMSSSNK